MNSGTRGLTLRVAYRRLCVLWIVVTILTLVSLLLAPGAIRKLPDETALIAQRALPVEGWPSGFT